MDEIRTWMADQLQAANPYPRPIVTLSWSQPPTIEGGYRGPAGLPFDENKPLTHLLRSLHEVILVGIGVVLADNPTMEVSLIKGRNPQPVILDTQLRIPSDSHLLQRRAGFPWIVAGPLADSRRCLELEKRGSIVIEADVDEDGLIDLDGVLRVLKGMGIRSLLVEGGVKVFTSFLSAGLADLAVISTIPNVHIKPPSVMQTSASDLFLPMLYESGSMTVDTQLVSWGRLQRQS